MRIIKYKLTIECDRHQIAKAKITMLYLGAIAFKFACGWDCFVVPLLYKTLGDRNDILF
ncbi:hypothetical protein [Nostoc sp. DSM 114159]